MKSRVLVQFQPQFAFQRVERCAIRRMGRLGSERVTRPRPSPRAGLLKGDSTARDPTNLLAPAVRALLTIQRALQCLNPFHQLFIAKDETLILALRASQRTRRDLQLGLEVAKTPGKRLPPRSCSCSARRRRRSSAPALARATAIRHKTRASTFLP